MFEKKPSIPFQSGTPEVTYIAADCEISGKVTLKGNARIDGKVEGTISISGDLIIGTSAVLKAAIEANTVSVSGEVRGDITAKDKLELSSSARLHGDIYTQQLKIDSGAHFIGTSRMLEDASKETPVVSLKETAEQHSRTKNRQTNR